MVRERTKRKGVRARAKKITRKTDSSRRWCVLQYWTSMAFNMYCITTYLGTDSSRLRHTSLSTALMTSGVQACTYMVWSPFNEVSLFSEFVLALTLVDSVFPTGCGPTFCSRCCCNDVSLVDSLCFFIFLLFTGSCFYFLLLLFSLVGVLESSSNNTYRMKPWTTDLQYHSEEKAIRWGAETEDWKA